MSVHLIILFTILRIVKSANILAVSHTPFYSHQLFSHAIFKELAARGHNLTIFTTHPSDYSQFPNVIQHHFNESVKIKQKYMNIIEYKQKSMNAYKTMMHDRNWLGEALEAEVKHPEMQKLIKNKENYKFDVIILEFLIQYFAILAEIFNCPIIVASAIEPTAYIHGTMGNDVNYAHYPNIFLPYLHRHLTFSQRINSLSYLIYNLFLFKFYLMPKYRKIHEKYFSNIDKDFEEAFDERAVLMLVNTNVAFGHIRPLMPNTIQVGFLHVEPPKQIQNEKLLTFLDNSKNGVIVMNFGSLSDTKKIRNSTIEKFLKVFNQTKFDVIIKLHKIDQKIPKNVFISDWLPLADVLAHPKVKVFIFHGGLFSAYEAIDREIPMIIFPFAYDQGSNARMLVHNEVAIELDFNTFTEIELLQAIDEMNLEKYKENVKKFKQQVYDQPISNRNLTIWHIENVINNKNILKVITASRTDIFKSHDFDIIFPTVVLVYIVKKFLKK
ncbi:hypothetical protein PVAND_009352 [Polypedilum vanderplanki]|uniref:UDP-glucuronosyltransferase n=1 Tax=Polypedilum vanderplanki TaxID=319348 RepID=A0A9J6CDU2_POLVA|nr:hypothetical protein PVAND_009352 [Polypedilum vanderplanki]